MPSRHTRSEASPFAALEQTFALLCAEPRPLALDGTGIEGLPDRPIPLTELRARLLHPCVSYATRDAALNNLIKKARTEGAAEPGDRSRLGRGQLRGLVLAYLRDHPGEHTPTAVARALEGRSAGAVGNALAKLADAGEAVQTSPAPRRYRATGS